MNRTALRGGHGAGFVRGDAVLGLARAGAAELSVVVDIMVE